MAHGTGAAVSDNSKLIAKAFRVRNFRNIDDSGRIPLERVTAFVGRNESGKTTLLKALHKFNPATPEPYKPQREFPRDRFTRDFRSPADWPVCEVEFEFGPSAIAELSEKLPDVSLPKTVTCTRYYDDSVKLVYDADVTPPPISPDTLAATLNEFVSKARRLSTPTDQPEQEFAPIRAKIVKWGGDTQQSLKPHTNLRTAAGAKLLTNIIAGVNALSAPYSADLVEEVIGVATPLLDKAKEPVARDSLDEYVRSNLPVFIYFENYGILDSAIYLPSFLSDLERTPDDPRVRTVNAMFKHVQLTAAELQKLGREEAETARNAGQTVTAEMIRRDSENKELRAVKTNAASLDITDRFSKWYGQRRHTIRYHADGDYFRIWISDDRRPGVEIELESRSKGFQWFFSFYLVFLVESEEGHKDAILLLDEPGLNLHPTAQQELMAFFDRLAETNQLLYTTHSPFLIDGEHIHRVRPVTETEDGHSKISIDGWPEDRETIFPLQAAAGYAMVRGLFQNKKNVLVEGMADYLYLHALNLHCRATGRKALPEDVYVTPCGGTKMVGHLASLFLGQNVRPVVLLDGDDAGRVRRDALMKELYQGHEKAVVMLDEALAGTGCEIEDILGEEHIVPVMAEILGEPFALGMADRTGSSVVEHIKAAAKRLGIVLPEGWKPEVARRIAVDWSTKGSDRIPAEVLDRASAVFSILSERFVAGGS